MPVFGFGTWQMGGKEDRNPENNDEADILAIQQAIEAGITHIDTAERYAGGYAETLAGVAMQKYPREKLFLASKVAPYHLRYDDVLTSLDATLKRLQTTYLDLYYIHSANPDIPIAETMKAMDKLLEEGLIKNIAVSNFTVERMKEAQTHTKNKIVATQVHYNLIFREPERKGVLKYCQENDIMLVAYRPVQKGLLTSSNNELMNELCKKYQKIPSQIAINWLTSQKNVVTLSKMGSEEHLEENLGAIGWEMEKEDVEKLDQDFPGQQDVSDSAPLL